MTMMIMMMGEGSAGRKIDLIETGKFAVQLSGNLAKFHLLKFTRGKSN